MVVAEVSYGVQGADSTSNGRNPPCTFTSLTTQLSPQSSKSPFTHGRYLNEEKKKGRQGGRPAGRQEGHPTQGHNHQPHHNQTAPAPAPAPAKQQTATNSFELEIGSQVSQSVSQSVTDNTDNTDNTTTTTPTPTHTNDRKIRPGSHSTTPIPTPTHPPTFIHSSFIHFHHGHSLSTLSLRRRSPQHHSYHRSTAHR